MPTIHFVPKAMRGLPWIQQHIMERAVREGIYVPPTHNRRRSCVVLARKGFIEFDGDVYRPTQKAKDTIAEFGRLQGLGDTFMRVQRDKYLESQGGGP